MEQQTKGALILCFILFELLLFTAAHDYMLTKKHNELVRECKDDNGIFKTVETPDWWVDFDYKNETKEYGKAENSTS